jgi:hypothetical protein
MPILDLLRNRIDLTHIPFTDRGSRLLLSRQGHTLTLRLAERWVKWEQEVGHYRQRLPIVQDFAVFESDQPLTFEIETFPHLVRIITQVGDFEWIFVDPETLLIKLPPGQYDLQFTLNADSAETDRRGGVLHGKRNIAYTTNAHLLQNVIRPLNAMQYQVRLRLEANAQDGFLLNITPRLGFNRSIPNPDKIIQEAQQRWTDWFEAAPPVLEPYRRQYYYAWWIMCAGLLNQRYFFTREALAPSKIHYVGVWHWDQFFHAIAYRHINTKLAEDQLRILIDHQRADGMLPDAIHDEGLITHLSKPVEADVTKPPLMAWTVLKLFEKSGHLDFLYEVYGPLLRWQNWWTSANLDENGLCMYRHPFSSGLDDSPLWDKGMPVTAPDLNTYLVIQLESLARIAELIGEGEDATRFRQQAWAHSERIKTYLWDNERGIFNALYHGQAIPTLTPFQLLPLWTGHFSVEIMDRLIYHLTNPREFWVNYPLPTVSISDPKFDPLQMWRGPTWANIDYLFIEALQKIGRLDLAHQLRLKTLDLMLLHEDIYEYYHPLTGDHPPKAAPLFGWSAAIFIDLAIQVSHQFDLNQI